MALKFAPKTFMPLLAYCAIKINSGYLRLYGLGLRLIQHNLATIQQQLSNNSATVTQQSRTFGEKSVLIVNVHTLIAKPCQFSDDTPHTSATIQQQFSNN